MFALLKSCAAVVVAARRSPPKIQRLRSVACPEQMQCFVTDGLGSLRLACRGSESPKKKKQSTRPGLICPKCCTLRVGSAARWLRVLVKRKVKTVVVKKVVPWLAKSAV